MSEKHKTVRDEILPPTPSLKNFINITASICELWHFGGKQMGVLNNLIIEIKLNIETKFLIHKFLGKRTHFVCIFLYTYFTVHTTNILLCKLWYKANDSLHDRFREAIKTIKQYCKFDRVIFFYVDYRLHF